LSLLGIIDAKVCGVPPRGVEFRGIPNGAQHVVYGGRHGTEGGAAWGGGVVCSQSSALIKLPGKFYGSGKGVVIFWLGWLLPAAHVRMGMMCSNQQFVSITNKFS
jgi:hypothetical protein